MSACLCALYLCAYLFCVRIRLSVFLALEVVRVVVLAAAAAVMVVVMVAATPSATAAAVAAAFATAAAATAATFLLHLLALLVLLTCAAAELALSLVPLFYFPTFALASSLDCSLDSSICFK